MAHALAPWGLGFYAAARDYPTFNWDSFQWKNLFFANRLGIAGGVDKNATMTASWQRLGVGFLEIGTVTPMAQSPNPGKIFGRDWENRNLWNKMGFPNDGSEDVYYNLCQAKTELRIPVFVNIGKNRNSKNSDAENEYLFLIEKFQAIADAFVINVSSPNTAGLRELQTQAWLESLLRRATTVAKGKPVLVKLSPDMDEDELQGSLKGSVAGGCSGFILTNTTLSRPPNCSFAKDGGLSGKDLAEKSKNLLKLTLSALKDKRKDLLIISVGGILCPEDVAERLALGADLVQTYSGLVFYGPEIFKDTAQLMNQPDVSRNVSA